MVNAAPLPLALPTAPTAPTSAVDQPAGSDCARAETDKPTMSTNASRATPEIFLDSTVRPPFFVELPLRARGLPNGTLGFGRELGEGRAVVVAIATGPLDRFTRSVAPASSTVSGAYARGAPLDAHRRYASRGNLAAAWRGQDVGAEACRDEGGQIEEPCFVEEPSRALAAQRGAHPAERVAEDFTIDEERRAQESSRRGVFVDEASRRINRIAVAHQRMIMTRRPVPAAMICLGQPFGRNFDRDVQRGQEQAALPRPPEPHLELAVLAARVVGRKAAHLRNRLTAAGEIRRQQA